MLVKEFEYPNHPEFKSQVNDFGDDYHDEEKWEDTPLLNKVRALKRKYSDFGEWCRAKEIYTEYGQWLIDKYGGMKRLKFLFQIGMVKDYVPSFCPKLKHNKKNRKYIDDGMPLETPCDYDFGLPVIPTNWKIPKHVKLAFSFKPIKGMNPMKMDLNDSSDVANQISNEIDMINKFYTNRTKPIKISKKDARKRMLREMYHKPKKGSFTAKYKEYLHKKDFHEFDEEESPDKLVFYKGISLTKEQMDEMQMLDYLESIGLHVGMKHLSKGSRKLIRKKKLKESGGYKDGKKKKHKKSNSYMKKFAEGEYHTFSEFEKDMLQLTGDQLRKMANME